jgi:hypothetical protein
LETVEESLQEARQARTSNVAMFRQLLPGKQQGVMALIRALDGGAGLDDVGRPGR